MMATSVEIISVGPALGEGLAVGVGVGSTVGVGVGSAVGVGVGAAVGVGVGSGSIGPPGEGAGPTYTAHAAPELP
jgi:hypothetical protein